MLSVIVLIMCALNVCDLYIYSTYIDTMSILDRTLLIKLNFDSCIAMINKASTFINKKYTLCFFQDYMLVVYVCLCLCFNGNLIYTR